MGRISRIIIRLSKSFVVICLCRAEKMRKNAEKYIAIYDRMRELMNNKEKKIS